MDPAVSLNVTVPPFAIVTVAGEKLWPSYVTVACIGATETLVFVSTLVLDEAWPEFVVVAGVLFVPVCSVCVVLGGGVVIDGLSWLKKYQTSPIMTRTTIMVHTMVEVFIRE